MRKLIGSVLVVIFIASCSKDQQTENIIQGQWKWEETRPVVAPPLIPQSIIRPAPGEVFLFDFKANQQFTYTRNGSTLRSGSYTIENNINGNYPLLSFSDQTAVYSITGYDTDTLVLISNAPGAGISKYSKY